MMFTKTFFICVTNILVKANPLLQSIQTYPSHYDYPYINEQLFNNIHPYSQHVLVQNHSPYHQPATDQLNEKLLNEVLSNPTIRTILDPNSKIFNHNGIEIPERIPVSPTPTPNVVNNYFIVPPEYMKLGNKTKEKGNKKSNRSQKKQKKEVNEINRNKENVSKDPKKKQKSTGSGRDKQRSKTKVKQKHIDENSLTDSLNTENIDQISTELKSVSDLKSLNKNQLSKNINKNKDFTCDNYDDIDELLDTNKQCIDTDRATRNSKVNTGYMDIRKQFPHLPEEYAKMLQSYTQGAMTNQPSSPYNFYPNNFNNMFPFNFEQMYQVPQTSNADNSNKNITRRRKNQRSSRKRSNKKSKTKDTENVDTPKKCDTVVELTPKLIEIEVVEPKPIAEKTAIEETTMQVETIELQPKVSYEPEIQVEIPEPMPKDEPTVKAPENTHSEEIHENNLPFESFYNMELGPNGEIPMIYDNELIDYYPDFTADNDDYFGSKEDLRNIPERYYYTTDRNVGTSERNRERRKYDRSYHKQHSRKHDKYIQKNSIEMYNKGREITEKPQEIQFRTPPGLDKIDFKTRKIHRSNDRYKTFYDYNDGDYEDPYNYKDATESSPIHTNFNNNKPTNDIQTSDVETVFAGSKVSKQGSKFTIRTTYDDNFRKCPTDGDTTIVLAKPMS